MTPQDAGKRTSTEMEKADDKDRRPLIAVQRPCTNRCAIVSLLSGLLLLGLPAFIFGIIGMREASRCDEDGWGMAFAGTILGGIELIAGAAVVGALLTGLGTGVAIQW